ncbi:FAA hydrolase family protein [Microvirga makkahensis]|uniref:FAA hydrolase family protein n=2 Tax=Microvirga makkahensis TaxID=1128670 RepID=A0A7X3MPL9_9HYPH|nr:fumarylacetoacetate hydrolase family protein [Microvirga makkahensis]MXQ10852.1 FAA hydrolase family protein [Microvirga makkahensis]
METHDCVIAPPARALLPVAGTSMSFPVRRIYCIGRNYVAHVREMGGDETRDPPIFFQKPADSIVLDGAEIPYPPMTRNYHFELELVVAIKTGGRDIPVADALDHIYGYGIGLDMTRRDLQMDLGKSGLPWEAGKAFDNSCPCGPIHPVERVGHVLEGSIRLTVDGEARQDSDLGLMIWKVPEIVANLSKYFTLEPGDIILTGTPAGVGPVTPGNELVGSIDKLGTLRVRISS